MGRIPLNERTIEPVEIFSVETYGGDRHLAWPTSEMYTDILREASSEGYDFPWFRLMSGYRSIAHQQRLYDKHPTKDPKSIAKPGRSSHHTGHAMDIYVGNKSGYSPTRRVDENVNFMRATPQYQWFASKIAPKYGLWELPSEPWHWECDRACRANYLMRKYGVNSDIASQVASGEVHVPNGDFIAYLDSIGADYKVASLTSTSSASKWVWGILVVGSLGLATWYITSRKEI